MRLPPSLDRDIQTVQREVALAQGMTPEERLHGVELACRAALDLLAYNTKAARILASSDPLPETSIRALERLHEQFRRQQE